MKKIKVQVMLNEEIVERLDKYAESIGTSRSAVCAQFIAQSINSMELAQKLTMEFSNGLSDNMRAKLLDAITKKGGE